MPLHLLCSKRFQSTVFYKIHRLLENASICGGSEEVNFWMMWEEPVASRLYIRENDRERVPDEGSQKHTERLSYGMD